jgi:hypothetical protein
LIGFLFAPPLMPLLGLAGLAVAALVGLLFGLYYRRFDVLLRYQEDEDDTV